MLESFAVREEERIAPHRFTIPTVSSLRGMLNALLCIAALNSLPACTITKETITFGYPFEQSVGNELVVKKWAHVQYDKESIGLFMCHNIPCEFLGKPEDLQKVVEVMKILKELPISPDQTLQKVVIIFSAKTEGRAQSNNDGVTPKNRYDGIQYILFSEDADPEIYKHELIHAFFQTEDAKTTPDFVREGVVYDLAGDIKDIPRLPVDATYLLENLDGLYAPNGTLFSKDTITATHADDLQYYVMRIFWTELTKIDPLVRIKILQTKEKIPSTMEEVPEFIIAHASPDKKDAVEIFLKQVVIFSPPKERNIFIVPELSTDGYPRIMPYFLDRNHDRSTTPLLFWYSSTMNGQTVDARRTKGTPITSNHPIEFRSMPAQNGFTFKIEIEVSTGKIQSYNFSFNAEKNEWQLL